MASVNKCIIVGNLGRDPETRHAQSGDAITNIAVATTDQWKDKNGEKAERTEWHRVVFFGRLAEVAGEYLKKGSQVYIEGALRTRKWTDQQGVEKYTTEIVADRMQMLGSRGPGNGEQAQGGGSRQESTGKSGSSEPYSRERTSQGGGGQTRRAPPSDDFSDFNDDIPFAEADFAHDVIGSRLGRRLTRTSTR